MTWHLFWLLIAVAGVATLIFIVGHKLGCRSCRHDYPDGWDAGQKAERDWWEHAAGITRGALARWQVRDQPEPGPEPAWPYGFRVDPVLPATEVLLAEADAALGKPVNLQGSGAKLESGSPGFKITRVPGVPSVADIDELAEQWHAAHGYGEFTRELADDFRSWAQRMVPDEPPIVADLTGPDAWHYPGDDDVPTITGHIVTDPRRTGPEWLEVEKAAQDADAAAYIRRLEAEMALARRGISAGAPR